MQVQSLALELPHAMGMAKKKKTKQNKKTVNSPVPEESSGYLLESLQGGFLR